MLIIPSIWRSWSAYNAKKAFKDVSMLFLNQVFSVNISYCSFLYISLTDTKVSLKVETDVTVLNGGHLPLKAFWTKEKRYLFTTYFRSQIFVCLILWNRKLNLSKILKILHVYNIRKYFEEGHLFGNFKRRNS